MECRSATKNNIQEIKIELRKAKEKKYSGNFLKGFPWNSTDWCKCDLKGTNLGDLYLFWDGSGWGESKDIPPRMLEVGVKDFKRIADNQNQENPYHLKKIIKYMKKNKKAGNSLRGSGTSPILVSVDKNMPLLILDGNHRLVTYWWKNSGKDRNSIDKTFWVGFSPNMNNYYYYSRIPSTPIS